MLPFVMLPRPLQESNVVGKGGTAGFLGRDFDPYTLFPDGDDMDMEKMSRIRVDDLQLRADVFAKRLERRARLRTLIDESMPEIDKAVADYKLDEYYERALNLVISGRAREAFALDREADAIRDRYGRNTFGQSCLLARRLVESGVRFVTVNHGGWDPHAKIFEGLDKKLPEFDVAFSALVEDLTGLVHHAGGDLGAAEVDADCKRHVNLRRKPTRCFPPVGARTSVGAHLEGPCAKSPNHS